MEGHGDVEAALLRRRFDGRVAGQHDQVGHRDLLATAGGGVEVLLDAFKRGQHLGQLLGLVHFPVLLRRKANAGAVGATALVAAAEGRGRGPGGVDQLLRRQAGVEHFLLQRGHVLVVHQRVVDVGHRVLPDQHFLGHVLAQVAVARAHVAVGQLEPGAREGVGELVRVVLEVARDLLVGRIHAHGHVGRAHHQLFLAARVVGRRRHVFFLQALGLPLLRTGRALGQLPVVLEQHVEVSHVPLGRRRRPGAFQAAGDGVAGHAGLVAVGPAEALVFDVGAFRLDLHQPGVTGTVRLAEGVATGGQRDRLVVVHGHAREGVADVAGRKQRIRVAVRAFRVHVDKAHLHGGQRVGQVAFAGIAAVFLVAGGKPFLFRAPEHVGHGLPDVAAAAAEAEGLEAHRFKRDVAGKDEQVGPGQLLAVLLLDRPQQAARLVEVAVVGPAVERREALVAGAAAAAAVMDAVSAGRVPGHADEEGTVVAVVGRPPVLGIGHQGVQVLDDGVEVEFLELFAVVVVLAHRVGPRRMAVEDAEVELVGPPVRVRPGTGDGLAAASAREGAFCFVGHGVLSWDPRMVRTEWPSDCDR